MVEDSKVLPRQGLRGRASREGFKIVMIPNCDAEHIPIEMGPVLRSFLWKPVLAGHMGNLGLNKLQREIHHTVKNDLQLIVSLLRLQAETQGCGKIRDFVNKAINQIMIMAILHDQLFESCKFPYLDFSSYVERIINNSVRTLNVGVNLAINLEPLDLTIENAMPCALCKRLLTKCVGKYPLRIRRERVYASF